MREGNKLKRKNNIKETTKQKRKARQKNNQNSLPCHDIKEQIKKRKRKKVEQLKRKK